MHKQNEARTPVKTNIDAPRSIYVEWLCYNDLFIVPNSVRKNASIFVRELKLLVFIRNALVLEQVLTVIELACFVCFH